MVRDVVPGKEVVPGKGLSHLQASRMSIESRGQRDGKGCWTELDRTHCL